MHGSGVLAVWNDCATGSEETYESWYQTEHLPERLGVPGFKRGRRYQALEGSPEYFTWYEVESPSVLRSAEYINCLSNPTPWTKQIMSGVFLNASRTVCKRHIIAGELFGSIAMTIRLEADASDQDIQETLKATYDPARVARIEKWSADEKPGDEAKAEEQIRGPDEKIKICFILETIREEDARIIATELLKQSIRAEIGIYKLLCEYPKLL
tara:strand:+ start:4607 stop:5242 length:636 start_codon:yes stop_codon:yes gene_type:complete